MLRISSYFVATFLLVLATINATFALTISNLKQITENPIYSHLPEVRIIIDHANSQLHPNYWSLKKSSSRRAAWKFFRTETGREMILPLLLQGRREQIETEAALTAISANYLARKYTQKENTLIRNLSSIEPWQNKEQKTFEFSSLKHQIEEHRTALESLLSICHTVLQENINRKILKPHSEHICRNAGSSIDDRLKLTVKNSKVSHLVHIVNRQVKGGKISEVAFTDERRVSICNFAPFKANFKVAPNNRNTLNYNMFSYDVDAGQCLEISLGYDSAPNFLYMNASPVRRDVAFKRLQFHASRKVKWQKGQVFLPSHPSGIKKFCQIDSSAIIRITDKERCPTDTHYFARVDVSSNAVFSEGPHKIRRASFDFYDYEILQRAPQDKLHDTDAIIRYVKGFSAALNRNARVGYYPTPRQVLGVSLCGDDDELSYGVTVCQVDNNLPHGAANPIRVGDRIDTFGGLPIFSPLDLITALEAFSETHGLKGPATPIYISVNGGYRRKVITHWNPRFFNGCPVDSAVAVLTSGLNALTIGLLETDPEMYGAVLMVEQFCSEENFAGTLAGSAASLSGLALKTVARAIFGKQIAKKAAKKILSQPVTHIALQGMEEFAYVYNTAPPLPPRRPLAEDAAKSTLYGLGLGVVVSKAGHILR